VTADSVPVTLDVGGRKLRASATRTGRSWLLRADAFPELPMHGMDLVKLQAELAKTLAPHCARVEAARRR
jgi:hypothetical protein